MNEHPDWCTRCTIGSDSLLVGRHRSQVVDLREGGNVVTAWVEQAPGRGHPYLCLAVASAGVAGQADLPAQSSALFLTRVLGLLRLIGVEVRPEQPVTGRER